MQNRFVPAAALAVVAVAASSTLAWDPQFAQFYVGIDGRHTLNAGTYSGLANPNYNRLTFLLGHSSVDAPTANHYHNKSAYSYTGANLGAVTAVNPRGRRTTFCPRTATRRRGSSCCPGQATTPASTAAG
jgi:hypothetical protein